MAKSKKAAKKSNKLRMSASKAKAAVAKPAPGEFKRPSLKLPSGMKMYSPKKGKSKLSIVLFEAGEGNPNFEKGEPAYERTYFVHRIGVSGESHLCLAETFGERCPVCEDRARLYRGDADDIEAAKKLNAKARQLWLVYDHDDSKSGVQLMEISYHAFGKQLRAYLEDEDDEAFMFADPEEGKMLEVKWIESSFGGGTFTEASNINMKDRKPLADSILAQSICLDDLLKKTDYDKLKEIYLQGVDEDDSDEEDDEDLDDDDLDEEDEEEEKPKKGKAKGKGKGKGKKKPEPEEDEEDDWDDEDSDGESDEDDSDDESDDEDDWDEDSDDEDSEEDEDESDDEDDEDSDDSDDEDDWDDEEDEEEEEPPKKKGKAKSKAKPAKAKGKGKGKKRK